MPGTYPHHDDHHHHYRDDYLRRRRYDYNGRLVTRTDDDHFHANDHDAAGPPDHPAYGPACRADHADAAD
jgi:hypothetical protein